MCKFVRHYLCLSTLSILVATTLGAAETNSSPLKILQDGRSAYCLYVSSEAIEPEQFAAEECQKWFEQATGVKLPIAREFPADGKAIVIGNSPLAEKLWPEVDFSTLRPDEILLKTNGQTLLLAGERPRGSVYAVYEFLETELGIRFFTPYIIKIPKCQQLTVDSKDYRYASPIRIREAFGLETNNNPFAVKMRNNGHYNLRLTPRMGGHNSYKPDLCHTFNKILPLSKYKSTNPEFFTLLSGERWEAQLCYSNKGMRRKFIENCLKYLDENPATEFLQLSQLDGGGEHHNCQCENCKVMREKVGSSTDMLVDFLNEVCEGVLAVHPDIQIETLAYGYTSSAPKTVKPDKRLAFRLCINPNDFSRSFGHPDNYDAKHNQDLRNWRKLGVSVSLWIYKDNYGSFVTPFPNYSSYDGELRYLLSSGPLFSVFLQGSQSSPSNFGTLKTYLGSKLLWNPDLKAEPIIQEFVEGVYQQAAPEIREYMRLLTGELHDNHRPLKAGKSTKEWLSLDTLLHCREVVSRGLARINKETQEPTWMEIYRLAVGLDVALCSREEFDWQIRTPEYAALFQKLEIEKIFASLDERLKNCGNSNIGEHITRASGLAPIRSNLFPPVKTSKVPDLGFSLKEIDYLEFNVPDLIAWLGGIIVDDPKAAVGKAGFMDFDHYHWPMYLQFPVIHKPTTYDVYISARCEAYPDAEPTSPAFGTGVYDFTAQRYALKPDEIRFTVEECQGEDYTFFHLGQLTCQPDHKYQVYVASQIDGGRKKVWIERVILIPR